MIDKILGGVYDVIPFILVLTIVVFIHEMGHFLIARYNGVHVRVFSIGYGPEIFGWTDKKGTRWRFSWIPFGGYVMMLGDADATSVKSNTEGLGAEDVKRTLTAKSPLQKMMVAFGGPLANIIFTLLAFIFMGVFEGLPEMEPRIQSVVEESVAQKCGLQSGDILTGINEDSIGLVSEIKELLEKYAGQDVVLHYERAGKDCVTNASLYEIDKDGAKTPVKVLGIGFMGRIIFLEASVGEVIRHSIQSCWAAAVGMVSGIFKTITGQSDGSKVGGLLSIGDIAKKSMNGGVMAFLHFMAMLSFSLAILNLLPIPVLDGGSILINFIEFIRRKALSQNTINVIYTGGMIAIGCLMLFANWNDLVNYGITKKICNFFKGLFGMLK